jgi:23S rRNA (cytidine1920-2'-O)/16S rRNA (cytidine1409-2'-O)-methyltransferase
VTAKRRADEALVKRGLAETRSKARALIMAGQVRSGDRVIDKAGAIVDDTTALVLLEPPRFVSRGGEKLAHALVEFQLDVTGMICADFGASTGGFTDCLLQSGAVKVYAIDVGYGQLDFRLRRDERVVVMERVNVRHLQALPEPVDLVVIDVSFISLGLVLPAARRVLRPDGACVALVKPQFEAGREHVRRGGVVRDPEVYRMVLERVAGQSADAGFAPVAVSVSPLRGPAGNREFLLLMRASTESQPDLTEQINRVTLLDPTSGGE